MCPNCGLIFDFRIGLEDAGGLDVRIIAGGHMYVDENGDSQFDEPEFEELCPRCGLTINDQHVLQPIRIVSADFLPAIFAKRTFVVEDTSHVEVVTGLAKVLGREIEVISVSGKSNVEASYQFHKSQGRLVNGYFMVDGDNQGNPHSGEPHFIHLDKYCIENYLLDIAVCAAISGKNPDDILVIIANLIKNNHKAMKEKGRFVEFLLDRLAPDDILPESLRYVDASEILPPFKKALLKREGEFLSKYLAYCRDNSILETVFPKRLVQVINGTE